MKRIRLMYYLLLISLFVACSKKESKQENTSLGDDVISVRTATVGKGSTNSPIQASGLVASSEEARLSFKTGGIIQKIFVKEGDRIGKGQLLAILNPTEINAQVAQATESVQKLERDLQRVTNLYRDSIATLEQVQNLTTALSVAKNNLEIAHYNKSFSEIHSSTSGVVVKKLMNEGELVSPGMPVLFVNSTAKNDWVIKVGVSDKDWALLREGNRAAVNIDAFPGQTFSAVISNLSVGADPTSGLYQVELKVAGANPSKMAAGLFAKSVLYPNDNSAVSLNAIPIDAVIEGNGNDAFVYTTNGNKAKRLSIKVAYFDNNKAFVANGLNGVTEVIVDGSAYLIDGAAIKIVK